MYPNSYSIPEGINGLCLPLLLHPLLWLEISPYLISSQNTIRIPFLTSSTLCLIPSSLNASCSSLFALGLYGLPLFHEYPFFLTYTKRQTSLSHLYSFAGLKLLSALMSTGKFLVVFPL